MTIVLSVTVSWLQADTVSYIDYDRTETGKDTGAGIQKNIRLKSDQNYKSATGEFLPRDQRLIDIGHDDWPIGMAASD